MDRLGSDNLRERERGSRKREKERKRNDGERGRITESIKMIERSRHT